MSTAAAGTVKPEYSEALLLGWQKVRWGKGCDLSGDLQQTSLGGQTFVLQRVHPIDPLKHQLQQYVDTIQYCNAHTCCSCDRQPVLWSLDWWQLIVFINDLDPLLVVIPEAGVHLNLRPCQLLALFELQRCRHECREAIACFGQNHGL